MHGPVCFSLNMTMQTMCTYMCLIIVWVTAICTGLALGQERCCIQRETPSGPVFFSATQVSAADACFWVVCWGSWLWFHCQLSKFTFHEWAVRVLCGPSCSRLSDSATPTNLTFFNFTSALLTSYLRFTSVPLTFYFLLSYTFVEVST